MSQLRFSTRGDRKIARKSPSAHSSNAVISPKRNENQLARQNALSFQTDAKLEKPVMAGLRNVSKLTSEIE